MFSLLPTRNWLLYRRKFFFFLFFSENIFEHSFLQIIFAPAVPPAFRVHSLSNLFSYAFCHLYIYICAIPRLVFRIFKFSIPNLKTNVIIRASTYYNFVCFRIHEYRILCDIVQQLMD